MSHRWDCPTDWEAEREGRYAGDRGRSRYSNPYADECHEAEQAWDRGYRRGMYDREEREAEERAAERRAAGRRQAAEEEEYYLSQSWYEEQESAAMYEAEMEAQYIADMERQYIEEQEHLSDIERALILMAQEVNLSPAEP